MLTAAEDALVVGHGEYRCPACNQLLGKTDDDGTVVSRIRRLSHHFANSEVRWVLVGGTVVVACWKCGQETVFRRAGGTVVV